MNLCDLLTYTWPNRIAIYFGDIVDQTGYNTSHGIEKNVYDTAEAKKYCPDYEVYEIKAYDNCINIFLMPKKPPLYRIKRNEEKERFLKDDD